MRGSVCAHMSGFDVIAVTRESFYNVYKCSTAPPGILNTRNICFLSSLVHMFFCTTELNDFVQQSSREHDLCICKLKSKYAVKLMIIYELLLYSLCSDNATEFCLQYISGLNVIIEPI